MRVEWIAKWVTSVLNVSMLIFIQPKTFLTLNPVHCLYEIEVQRSAMMKSSIHFIQHPHGRAHDYPSAL